MMIVGSERNASDRRNGTALRASAGQLTFADDVEAPMRETIREMWVNRLGGFREQDLVRYLRDNMGDSRFVVAGRTWSIDAFRRFNRALFVVRYLVAPLGVIVEAEALDVHVTRERGGYVARGWLVVMVAGRVLRQSRLTMPIVSRAGRWVWADAVDRYVRRRRWKYAKRQEPSGTVAFVPMDG